MVADMEVDIVATVNKEVHHHKFALANYTAMSFIFVNIFIMHKYQKYKSVELGDQLSLPKSLRRSLALALALALVFNIILKILKY